MNITVNVTEQGYSELKETFREAYKWVCKHNNLDVADELPKYLQDEVMRLTEHWFNKRNA